MLLQQRYAISFSYLVISVDCKLAHHASLGKNILTCVNNFSFVDAFPYLELKKGNKRLLITIFQCRYSRGEQQLKNIYI